jgi:hypothetical protein
LPCSILPGVVSFCRMASWALWWVSVAGTGEPLTVYRSLAPE